MDTLEEIKNALDAVEAAQEARDLDTMVEEALALSHLVDGTIKQRWSV